MQTRQDKKTIILNKPVLNLKQKLMQWLRLSNVPIVKLYHGYGFNQKLFIQGHVFALSAMPRKKHRNKFLVNLFSLIRLFTVKPIANAHVQLHWKEMIIDTETDEDGFFKFEFTIQDHPLNGWHEIMANLLNANGKSISTGNGFIYIPHVTQFGFISDIDDTFLISHSSTILKRLQVLFTNNAHSRKPFEGVVEHYKLLAEGHTNTDEPNPFFMFRAVNGICMIIWLNLHA